MPIACLCVPNFALRVALLVRPELDGAPLVLGAPPEARPIVLDANPEAVARGVRPGMLLREVTALCPGATVFAPDPLREADVAADLVARLDDLSPAVELDPDDPGLLYIDLAGSERLLGSPEAVARQILASSPPLLRPRLGVGPGRFPARVAAGLAPPGGTRIIDPAGVAAFLAPVAVGWLPVSPDLHRRLERLGIRTLGDLATLPPGPVAARFGPAGRRAWDLARGNDDTPVRPRSRQETVVET
ncbi:MAG: DNA polymerase Y family protein, partial [Thermomicrobiales bacterium]